MSSAFVYSSMIKKLITSKIIYGTTWYLFIKIYKLKNMKIKVIRPYKKHVMYVQSTTSDVIAVF